MPICSVGQRLGCAALLLLMTSPVAAADEGRLNPSAPAAGPAKAAEDTAPTGALRPPAPISRLDLSPPPGLSPDLPPEAPPAVSEAPPAATVVGPPPADSAHAEVAPAEAAPAAADALATDIHAVLDRFVTAKPTDRPLGAGDWEAARRAIASVYAARNYAPLWIDGDHFSTSAKSALARLARAGEDGLDLAGAPLPSLDAAPGARAEADVEISAAVVAYALQATGARINPRAVSKDVSAKPEVADPALALTSVATAADPDAALAAFNPPQAGYRALRDALTAAREEAIPVARFSPGPVLMLGMSDPRVPLIRARFGLSSLKETSSSQVYDVRVASAVAAFQRVHGLPVNGALTLATANALNGADSRQRREQLLLANMEMWRWEPRAMGETRVEVNVPDFSLKLMRGDQVVHRARVIVGKPDTPTPIFSNSIKYMLFNPVWRVPESIVKKEMAPKYAVDPDYFARHGYKVSYAGDKLMVEQPPGEANALGRMLFLFPNEHAVYLHDTPQRSLFSASYRAFSHGCVRVEDPARLAEIVMGGAARGWTDAKVRALLGDKERTLSLPVPVPIHIEYFTEIVDENGALHERDDLYGLTGKVAAALARLNRSERRPID